MTHKRVQNYCQQLQVRICDFPLYFYFTLHRHQRKDWHPRNPCEHLAVLAPAHVEGALTEDLTLHVDTVLADEAHATLAAGHSALAGALAVVLGVGSVKLVRDASLSHFCKLFKNLRQGERDLRETHDVSKMML